MLHLIENNNQEHLLDALLGVTRRALNIYNFLTIVVGIGLFPSTSKQILCATFVVSTSYFWFVKQTRDERESRWAQPREWVIEY